MNIFQKVTLQSLWKNKTRTVVTVIGIILSAAMICAVTTFVSSMRNFALQNMIYQEGDWHGKVLDTQWQTCQTVMEDAQISDVVYAQQLGYAIAAGCTNEYKPYLYVLGASEGFAQSMPVHLSSGRFPQEGNEILLPDHLAENGGVRYGLGDTLTLDLGLRMLDGYDMGQNNPCYIYDENGQEVLLNETLQVREQRSYTVVGFYERPDFEEYTAPGYTCITIGDDGGEAYSYDVYFKMKNARDVYTFIADNALEGSANTDVLMYMGVGRFNSFYTVLYGMAVIVIVLIMFGSISLIYNAFSISVSERTKQFGLLSSLGATKKQLRAMVMFEALTVSAIGIPLGIVAGIGGIGVTLLFIGSKFSSLGSFPIPMEICVSAASVFIACIVALVTVLISAWIPSKRAMKVSAVEAIRQNPDIQVKGREVRTSKLAYKLFGLPGVLAQKHFKRNRRKYRSTVVSLFMSIVLFVSASAFTEYLMDSVGGSFYTESYDITYYSSPDELADRTMDELLVEIKADNAVTGAAYTQYRSVRGRIRTSSLNPKLDPEVFNVPDETLPEGMSEVRFFVSFVNDSEFKTLLRQHGLSQDLYMDPDAPLAVAVDGMTYFDYTQEKYVSVNLLAQDSCQVELSLEKDFEGYYCVGTTEDDPFMLRYVSEDDQQKTMDVPQEEAYNHFLLECGTVIDEPPYYCSRYTNMTFIYPISLMSSVLPGEEIYDDTVTFYITSSDHAVSERAIKETLVAAGLQTSNIINYAEGVEQERNIVTIITVFSYGFIVLISLIAAANVFNTISTNVGLRRREFAMLKSVGMTARGFNRMMCFECVLYGTKALLYGLPVSAVATFLIYLTVSAGYSTGFYLPWIAMGIASLSVFIVVFATMLYAMEKIKKDNPIDALKNENL